MGQEDPPEEEMAIHSSILAWRIPWIEETDGLLAIVLQSHAQLFVTLWTLASSALSIGFSRQEYWSGLPCPPLGDLPQPGIKPRSPALQADS